MKKKIITAIASIMAFAAIIAATTILVLRLDTGGVNLVNKITYLKYSYGSYFGGEYDFLIEQENGKTMFYANGSNGIDHSVEREINDQDLAQLTKIVADNKIDNWDGFEKLDSDILDGYSFELNIKYEDGKEIVASGYENYPQNYNAAHDNLEAFLLSIQ